MRPNMTNVVDACCKCGEVFPTPKIGRELEPEPGQLGLWQPTLADPPQWICEGCHKELDEALQKGVPEELR